MTHSGLIDIIERETHGSSYRVEKISADSLEHEQENEDSSGGVWLRNAESSTDTKYIDIKSESEKLSRSDKQILNYFIDSARQNYKVDDIVYSQKIYPIIAGQIGVACCKRTAKKLLPFIYQHEIVIALPDVANFDGQKKFFSELKQKLNDSLSGDLKISVVLNYSTLDAGTKLLDDRARDKILSRSRSYEIKLIEYLTEKNLLSDTNYLVKDGTLESLYAKDVDSNNYNYVLGVVKNFNPEICINSHGQPDPLYIAELPLYNRTQAALFTNPEILGDKKIIVWYLRMHDKRRTHSVFDGVIKLEKILSSDTESITTQEINKLSAFMLNERSPVCMGKDSNWANYIYPSYLTEQYIKSKYISAKTFLQIF
ncbi:MAG: hypothetical protein IJT21_05310 [Synergistaceae bacterium]|nr:hypothetical protein [Synergistaceae bacterium]